MFTCSICSYTTDRKSNFESHNKRKYKCHPIEPQKICVQNVIEEPKEVQNIQNMCHEVKDINTCDLCKKCLSSPRSLQRHRISCNGCHSLQCSNCFKEFNSPQSKYYHINHIKCEKYKPPESVQEENERLKKENKQKDDEIEALRSRPITTNTGNTINNGNVINNTTTNINVVQYNNYDKPYTDHITNKVMKCIYETSQRDPALILNETVRRIYKNDKHPENHVIKIGEKTALSRVYKDGKEIWLPMDGVIQSVMSSTGEFCADRIRDCHEEGVIIGDRARYVWQLMEVLGTDDREDDCLNRSSYVQSIKSAFL